MTDIVQVMAKALSKHDRFNEKYYEKYLDDAKAALQAIEDAGFVIMPKEPSMEMIRAANHNIYESGTSIDRTRWIYRDMISKSSTFLSNKSIDAPDNTSR